MLGGSAVEKYFSQKGEVGFSAVIAKELLHATEDLRLFSVAEFFSANELLELALL